MGERASRGIDHPHRWLRSGVLSLVILIGVLALAGVSRADSRVWTSQADFQSGSMLGLDATSTPGSLTLARNATTFAPYAGNPVFTPNPSGWDRAIVIPYTVLQIGGTWTMWYFGSNGTGGGIGRAISTDGIHWTRSPTTAVLAAAQWPNVLYEAGTYKMWYESVAGSYQPTAVEYATSADGIQWTPYAGNPVLAPSSSDFDSLSVAPGGVVHDASGYRMWYTGNDGSLTYSIGLATSFDGINWTRYSGNPIISPGFGGTYDSVRVITCNVLPWNGELLMGYVGTDSSFVQRIALATSIDGVHWAPIPGPTLDVGPTGSWDSFSLSRMAIANVDGNLSVWYGGSPSAGYWETGFATADSYASLGAFASAVIDSGNANTAWTSLQWVGSTPSGTAIGASLQVGNSSTPDSTWTLSPPSVNASTALQLPRSRYARVLVALVSMDPNQTPMLQSISVTYQPPTGGEYGGLGLLGFILLVALVVGAAVAFLVVAIVVHQSRAAPPGRASERTPLVCPWCGSAVPAGNSFCGRCGSPMNPPVPGGPPRT